MRLSYEEKLNLLISSNDYLLEKSSETMSISCLNLTSIIEHDLKYRFKNDEILSMLKSERTIIALTKELSHSKSLEEISSLRKQINYHINKIKKELIKKNVEESKINTYLDETIKYRKSISNYVRLVKRIDNIKEINILNSNKENLSLEDKDKLKKLMRNEADYYRKKLHAYNKPKEETIIVKEIPKKKVSFFDRVKNRVASAALAITVGVTSMFGINLGYASAEDKEIEDLEKELESVKITSMVNSSLVRDEEVENLNVATTYYVSTSNIYNDPLVIEEVEEVEEIELTNEEKEDYLIEYFNMDNKEQLYKFYDSFINTMQKYNKDFTYENMNYMFYEISQKSLEEKEEFAKEKYSLEQEDLESLAATHIAEGYGGGKHYEDVFASTKTGLNHTEFPLWINSTEQIFGDGTGNNLYFATCNKGQFEAYQNDWYYAFLGDRELVGYRAVLDAIMLDDLGVHMHDFTEYRSPSSSNKGTQFVDGGNKYRREFAAEDRIIEAHPIMYLG